jgi:hypothetical protein
MKTLGDYDKETEKIVSERKEKRKRVEEEVDKIVREWVDHLRLTDEHKNRNYDLMVYAPEDMHGYDPRLTFKDLHYAGFGSGVEGRFDKPVIISREHIEDLLLSKEKMKILGDSIRFEIVDSHAMDEWIFSYNKNESCLRDLLILMGNFACIYETYSKETIKKMKKNIDHLDSIETFLKQTKELLNKFK